MFRFYGGLAGILGELLKCGDTSWEQAVTLTDGFIHDGLVLSLEQALVEKMVAWVISSGSVFFFLTLSLSPWCHAGIQSQSLTYTAEQITCRYRKKVYSERKR